MRNHLLVGSHVVGHPAIRSPPLPIALSDAAVEDARRDRSRLHKSISIQSGNPFELRGCEAHVIPQLRYSLRPIAV
jgi:hypothetical protein